MASRSYIFWLQPLLRLAPSSLLVASPEKVSPDLPSYSSANSTRFERLDLEIPVATLQYVEWTFPLLAGQADGTLALTLRSDTALSGRSDKFGLPS